MEYLECGKVNGQGVKFVGAERVALVPKQKYLSCDQNGSSVVKTHDRGGRREFTQAKGERDGVDAGKLGY